MADRVGQQIGNYRLVRLLGSGGFADVYLGQHVDVQHLQAAIKILREQLSQQYQNAFLQEAQVIASLEHPHIIRILDYGRGETSYIIMEYAPQGTLRILHPKGSIVSPLTVVSYVNQIAPALKFAHVHGLIHRDLKPENFLIVKDGRVVVSDFGIAEKAHNISSMMTGAYAGTLLYSAPEQIAGKPRPASDQYSLAAVVYEWLCGQPPFKGNETQLMYQHQYTIPQPPREIVPTVPPDIEQVVMIALAKDPKDRFRSVSAFANALEQVSRQLQGGAVVGPRVSNGLGSPQEEAVRHEPEPDITPARRTTTGTPVGNITANRLFRAVVIGLILVLVIGAGVITRVVTLNQFAYQEHASATATVTSQKAAEALATKVAAATATAIANPYGGTLVLNDPLRDSSRGSWDVGDGNGGDCEFRGNAYHVSQSNTNYFNTCNEPTDFRNFAFEVRMTIVKGDCGGLVFRSNRNTGQSYDFEVCQDGSYRLVVYVDFKGANSKTLISSSSSAIHTGLNAPNVIAVVANSSTLDLYVNMQKIASVPDSSYSHGTIALIADPYNNNPTEVVYSNAKVWTLVPQSNVTTQTPTTNVNPYTNTGKLALNDPLQDSSLGNGWYEGADQSGKCAFTGGAYHVSTFIATSGYSCVASPDFSNFAFEVQMTILKGDQGGIVFRYTYDNGLNADYRFDVVQDGSYELIAEKGPTTLAKFKTLIKLTSNPAIHQGLGQTNIIAVVAQGSTITLYVNEQQIASVTDNNFSHGNIGLVAAANATGGHPTEVAYRNAKVWTL